MIGFDVAKKAAYLVPVEKSWLDSHLGRVAISLWKLQLKSRPAKMIYSIYVANQPR